MSIATEKVIESSLYFIGVFLYIWMNFVIITRMGAYFGINTNTRLLIVLIVLSLSYLVSLRLERKITNKYTRILYIASVYWMGLLFIFFVTIILFDIISRFYQIPLVITMTGIGILFIIIIPFALRNGRRLTMKELTFHHPLISKELTIVQLTDLHLGSIHTHKFLPRVFHKIGDKKYDCIVITGDLADGSAPITSDMVEAFSNTSKPIFFVSGNHDYLNGVERFNSVIAKTPIRILKNTAISFKGIQIVGLEYSKQKNHVFDMLDSLSLQQNKYTVLLNHTPIRLKKLAKYPINLCLCGHTHHGQIKPAHIFARLTYKEFRGLHTKNDTSLYIAPGTGNWGPPMRIGTRNEITFIHLKPQKN